MNQIRKRLTYANVMSSLSVFLILGGATAIAAIELDKNSVGPKQLKRSAVTPAKIKKNAVTTAKLKDGAVTTSKIANDAVTGDKVNEATLGRVPSATHATNADTVGGLSPAHLSVAGSGYKASGCDPSAITFIECTSVTLNLPHSGQVVLVGAGGENSFGAVAEGTCQFSVDGVSSSTPSVDPGESASDNTSATAQNGFALTTVTETLSAGSHSFALVCNQRGGDVEMHDTSISAHLVG